MNYEHQPEGNWVGGESPSACGLVLRILGRMLHLVPGVLCFPLHLISYVFDLGLGLISPLFDLTLGTPYCTVHLTLYLMFIHDFTLYFGI